MIIRHKRWAIPFVKSFCKFLCYFFATIFDFIENGLHRVADAAGITQAQAAAALDGYAAAALKSLADGGAALLPGMGKFTGRGTTAYDNGTGEYVQTWLDSMSTGIMTSKGKSTDDKTIEVKGESTDPLTKQKVSFRTVSKFVDENTHEMEMFESKGGEERKLMKIVYKRVKK